MNRIGYHPLFILVLFLAGWFPFTLYLLASNKQLINTPHLSVIPVILGGGIIWLLYGNWRTFHRGRQGGADLEQTRELLEVLLQHPTDAIAIMDAEGRIERINHAYAELTGYTEEMLLGKKQPHLHKKRSEDIQAMYTQVLQGSTASGCETWVHQNGSPLAVSYTLTPVFNQRGEVVRIIGCSRDLTERKRIEQELKASKANYRLITENMSDMIFVYQPSGNVLYASASHTKQLGYPIHELVAMKPDELAGLIHPDDLAMVAKVFTRDWEKCSGTTIVFRIRHQEGHWISIESRYNPILDEAGRLDSVMIVSRDVSEVMHTKELLRQTDKLSAIGQLAAGIAHEIRNPLTSLRGFVQLLQASLADPRYCEIMLAELDRINFIVSELLVLAKPKQMKFQDKKPTQIIYDVISLLESQANMNNVIFHDHLERSLPTISCDENQLKQVFINVCKNAIEALPEGGDIYVESSRLAGSRIRISIRDTGKGIDPIRIPRLGEPFYTTKENGTGLGLMVSYRILEEHGGSLTIESEPEKGTTVHITLPV